MSGNATSASVCRLKSSPLVETALSVVVVRPQMTKSEMESFFSRHAADYLKTNEFSSHSLSMTIGQDAKLTEKTDWIGLQHKKGENIVLSLKNCDTDSVMFLFSVLRPYFDWSHFWSNASPLLDAFLNIFPDSKTVSRIGVRSINRLDPPFPNCRIVDIIKTVPFDVADLQNPMALKFSYQDSITYPEFGLTATVKRFSQSLAEKLSVILDIDVFDQPMKVLSINDINDSLTKIVDLKDRIFFGSIGDKCLEKYR